MSASRITCPCCGRAGTKVPRVTLDSLLKETVRSALDDGDSHFCRTAACTVVYFNAAGTEAEVSDLVPVVFQKSSDPARLVCYCFSHTARDVEEEALRTGSSAVLESVIENCQNGLDRCEETNPQGFCCLGNIKWLMQRANATRSGDRLPEEPEPCCDPGETTGGEHA